MANFSSYIKIVNNSNFTLTLDKKENTHGSYTSEPTKTLKPGESTKFTLKDPAASYGSEGYLTYKISDGGELRFDYDCPYGSSDNVLKCTKTCTELEVFVYGNNDAKYIESPSCLCGDNIYPKDGHPLSGIFVIKNPENVTLGYGSLNSNEAKSCNTAIGYNSLHSNIGGNSNSSLGFNASKSNISGEKNVAIGFESMLNNINGSFNVAVGNKSLSSNTGSRNNAFGSSSLYNNNSGEDNCAFGDRSLYKNTTGNNNTAFGFESNLNIENINYTTAIGANTKAEYNNSTAIGANAKAGGENKVRIGADNTDVYVTSLHLTSDERDKTDIKETSLGLDFILGLRPVEYRWDMRSNYEDGKKDGTKKGKRFHHGFIAQDFQKLDIDFAGFQDHKLNGGEDRLTLNYQELIAPLVKAIQDQQNIIEKQQGQIDLLSERLKVIIS